MIRPEDFQSEIYESERGTCVRVTHLQTGHVRSMDSVEPGAVSATRDLLISELHGLLYDEKEFRCDTGHSTGGDFIRVVHLPTGIERTALLRESSREALLDAVLEELFQSFRKKNT